MTSSLGRFALRRSTGGNVAILVAMALPVIFVCAAGGTELAFVLADKGKLQDIADSAALAAAHELALATDDDVLERARTDAELQAAQAFKSRGPNAGVKATAELLNEKRSIRITMVATRASFFGNNLPAGGFKVVVRSTATGMGRTPLCVLARATKEEKAIKVEDASIVEAPGCLIHSNDEVEIKSPARVRAGAVAAVGRAYGTAEPKISTGSEPIKDPFENKWFTMKPCENKVPANHDKLSSFTIPPGVHCKDIKIGKNAVVTLASGYHYFRDGTFSVGENATLTGSDVTLFFDHDAVFEFKELAKVSLIGSKSGDFAGFVIMTLPKPKDEKDALVYDYGKDFRISSGNVNRLDGVVYVPMARLIIEGAKGSKGVAENSDWTVIVADHIEMRGAPKLVINKNYGVPGAPPVPDGVGPTESGARLSQ